MIKKHLAKILAVFVFSVSFGLVEATVAIYLRQIIHLSGIGSGSTEHRTLLSLGFINFLKPQSTGLIISTLKIASLETIREATTIIMLLAVAIVAGKTLREKFSYFLLSFGIWDIFYYVFLKIFIGWPKTLFDTDVFFLIPTPWLGPVITPLIASFLMAGLAIFLLSKGV